MLRDLRKCAASHLFFLLAGLWIADPSLPACAANADPACSRTFQVLSGLPSLKELRSRHQVFTKIGERHNREFLTLARNNKIPPGSAVFFDVENAVLKELNDSVIKDKDVVTAFTNLHKELVWAAVRKDPLLQRNLLAEYSDFKSLRMAFRGGDPSLTARLSEMIAQVNREFEARVLRYPDAERWAAQARGLAKRPAHWHLAGTGGTVDEAGLAGRHARTVTPQTGESSLQVFDHVKGSLQQKFDEAEELRKIVELQLATVPGMLTPTASRKAVLSREAIDVLRHVSPTEPSLPAWVTKAAKDLKDRFGHEFTRHEIMVMRNYLSAVDSFSPGLLQEKRTVIDLAEAAHGVLSIDFKGLGAKNLEESMKALVAGEDKPIREVLRGLREGEIRATEALNLAKNRVSDVTQSLPEPKRGKMLFSVDDGIFMPSAPLEQKEKKQLLRALAEKGDGAQYRVTFLPSHWHGGTQAIPNELRSEFIVRAEGLEKKIRKALFEAGHRRAGEKNLIAIDYFPYEQGGAKVGVWIAPHGGTPAAPEMEKLIKKVLREAGVEEAFILAP